MPGLVVIGAQWGDEGKGKLVDYLTSRADWAVRFQGGNNAGHTIVVNGVTTKLNLVPSGILQPHTHCLIAAGVVIDPEVFEQETEKLRQGGVVVHPARLTVDRDAQLVLAYHRAIDQAREEVLGSEKIGTTGRGIGPAYEDRANRSGVRVCELTDLPALRPRLEKVVAERVLYLQSVLKSAEVPVFEQVWSAVEKAAELLRPYLGNGSLLIDQALAQGKKVVFEGAQGTLLDQVHGTVPFVTSSNTIAGAVATGCGIGPRRVDYVLGVAKAYCTRVGRGPFPTELDNEIGDAIRKTGAEFGTVTGRPRRCGWFDAVALRRAVRLNGMDSLAITKLDVLSGLSKLKVCVGYRLDGKKLEDVPALAAEVERVVPEYIECEGWSEGLHGLQSWSQLPAAARAYLEMLAERVGCPISMVSVGAERNATLFPSGESFVKGFI